MAAPTLTMTVLAGPTVPIPLPPDLMARLRSVRVSESDEDRSAFTLSFDAGRSGSGGALDTPVLLGSPMTAFARVGILVTFGVLPKLLVDGIITTLELVPGERPGSATLTVTGEDIGYLLDREEFDAEHPALDDHLAVLAILAPYLADGISAQVIPPLDQDPPLPIDRVPTQHGSDLQHVSMLAERHGYVAYAMPGSVPGTSTFYWGPPVRLGLPQPALSVDLGPDTNVTSVRFQTDALSPALVTGRVQDRRSGEAVDVEIDSSLRPPLAALPLWQTAQRNLRTRRLRGGSSNATTATARAQAEVDRSIDAVTAQGELDGARYGDVLRPRALVGLRGAGWSHDGLWYVRKVDHDLAPGSYKQSFTLAREGYGSTLPAVVV
jgi:hypothetical protein